ncbi:MAG: glucuronate isomerase, partial [Verrucomicrobia bacterium]|nr:glucuronate isomerase [Verrucomicrobiota bacterium]
MGERFPFVWGMSSKRHPTLCQVVHEVVEQTPVFDIHTHLFDPAFRSLVSWGIDELLTYHYLIAESFRCNHEPAEHFWRLDKPAQADWIWRQLFLERSPISEACRGVLTTLQLLGLDVRQRDLPALRRHFAGWTPEVFTDRILEISRVRKVCMTNLPFDDEERPYWESGFHRHPAFVAALRLDPLLLEWDKTAAQLHRWGYDVRADLSGNTFGETRRFLSDWTQKMDSQYCMVSLPPEWRFSEKSVANQLIEGAVLPFARDHGQAFAMMIGVRRGVNPQLRVAGDSLAPADVPSVEALCAAFPENKFICTMLARENQHALCVAARKFRNLHIFGCWWFLNNPSFIDEMARMRIELLGLGVTPQHSDCRVMDQLVYKWAHSKPILARVLSEKYEDLAATGWQPS